MSLAVDCKEAEHLERGAKVVRNSWHWPAAIFFSLVLHAGLYWLLADRLQPVKEVIDQQAVVTRMLSFKPVPPTISEPPPKPLPSAVSESVPKTEPEPALPPEPVPVQKLLEPESPPVVPVVLETPPPISQPRPSPPPVQPKVNESDLLQRYLIELLAHIEKHKFYPPLARRRGVEGNIRVSFRVLPDGSMQTLEVEHGHGLLQRAVAETMERSLPLPKPPPEIDSPLEVQFDMKFELRS